MKIQDVSDDMMESIYAEMREMRELQKRFEGTARMKVVEAMRKEFLDIRAVNPIDLAVQIMRWRKKLRVIGALTS